MEFKYFREVPEVEPEMDEKAREGLEVIIEIDFGGPESGPEPFNSEEMMSDHYVFDEKYLVNETEQPEELELEDPGEMFKPRIP